MMSNQATDHRGTEFIIKRSRWLKKREFLAYYLLYKTFNNREFNIGDAIDLLMCKFCVTRKTAINIIDRLYRLRILDRVRPMVYRCRPLTTILDEYLETYITSKQKRCRKRA